MFGILLAFELISVHKSQLVSVTTNRACNAVKEGPSSCMPSLPPLVSLPHKSQLSLSLFTLHLYGGYNAWATVQLFM